MSKFSRDKGKRGERKLANELREAFPELAEEIRRGWQSREGDDDPDVMGVPGFWFEHKDEKRVNLLGALRQAIVDSKGRGRPLAVCRVARQKPVAAMLWEDLLELLKVFVRSKGNERDSVHEGRRRQDVRARPGLRWRVQVRAVRGPGRNVPGSAR